MTTAFPVPVSERHGLSNWDNCEPCSALMVANVACDNAKPATWDEAQALRVASGSNLIPMGPWDMVRAFKARYGWTVASFVGSQDQLLAAIVGGEVGAVNIWYNRWPYSLKIQKDFNDGHCLAVLPYNPQGATRSGYLWIIDPLFVPGSGYSGVWVGIPTIKAAMDNSLGLLLRPGQFVPATPPSPQVRVATGTFETYTARWSGPGGVGGRLRVWGHSTRTAPINTIYPVTPTEYPVFMTPTGTNSVAMRQIVGGPYEGLWCVAHGVLPYSQ